MKMNYSDYARKTTEQIRKECDRRGIKHYGKGREDMIGLIIDHDAYYMGRDDAFRGYDREGRPYPRKKVEVKVDVVTDGRKKYSLQEYDENNPVYLRLTKEQADVVKWLIDHNVSTYEAMLTQLEDIEFETP